MPTFTVHQLDALLNIHDVFKNDPYVKSSHKRDIDHLSQVIKYMEDHVDNNGADMLQLLENGSKKIYIGSEGTVGYLDFTMYGFDKLEGYLTDVNDDINEIANDSKLNRNPMMKPYLSYAKLIMNRGLMDHPDRNGYASDVVYNGVAAIAGAFTRIPTEAEMEQLRQTNKPAYDIGIKIMNYIGAFAEFNDPELLLKADQADKIDRQALQQERLRRLDKLEQAAQEFAGISAHDLFYFYDIIGCPIDGSSQLTINADLFENKKHTTEVGIKQLQDYKRLMQQGLTLEEARLLSDVTHIVKYIPSDFFMQDMKTEFLPGPVKAKWEQLEEAARIAKDKIDHGFASEQEKDEVFKAIGTAFEELSDTCKNYQPDYSNMSPEEQDRTQYTYNMLKRLT